MACVGCQQRREAIARVAKQIGTIVFGGGRRKLADFAEKVKAGQPASKRKEAPADGDTGA